MIKYIFHSILILLFGPSILLCQGTISAEQINTAIRDPLAILPIDLGAGEPNRYLVRSNDSLYVLDESYATIHKQGILPDGFTRIICSDKGKYFLLKEILSSPESKTTPGRERWSIYDVFGNFNIISEETVYWDEADFVKRTISDYNGKIYALDAGNAVLKVYSINGSLLNKLEYFSADTIPERPKYGYIDFLDDGQKVAIFVQRRPSSRERTVVKHPIRGPNKGKAITYEYERINGEPHLFLLDSGGNILQTKTFSEDRIGKMSTTRNGEIILCTLEDYDNDPGWITYFLDDQLNINGSINIYPNSSILINNRLICAYIDPVTRQHRISSFSFPNGVEQWKLGIAKAPNSLGIMDRTSGLYFYADKNKDKEYLDCIITVFNEDGETIDSIRFKNILDAFIFDEYGRQIIIRNNFIVTNGIIQKVSYR